MGKLPDHRLDLGALVLQREIAMAGGVGAAKTGDLAADPDMAIGVLHRPLQRGGQLRDGEFGRVGERFGHLWRFGVLGLSRNVGSSATAANRACGVIYSV